MTSVECLVRLAARGEDEEARFAEQQREMTAREEAAWSRVCNARCMHVLQGLSA